MNTLSGSLDPIEDIIEEIKQGRPVIMVDDEDRENEGDLIVAAEHATPEIINFMIRECGGFVCVTIHKCIAERLNLTLQPRRHVSDQQAHFTVSVEGIKGVDTGVSAKDRATTIQTIIDPQATRDDIATPGHVFPLIARDNGVLDRPGHTETSVDLPRLAGLQPAGVLCEIMNPDGTMARLPELILFAKKHDLKIGCVEHLVQYRKKQELKKAA